MNILKESINVQVAIMENAGMSLKEGFNTSDIVNYINNMLPAILFLQGMIVTFIIYALETFVLRRITVVNLRLPKFIDFYLPGNAVTASFTFFLFCFFGLAGNHPLRTRSFCSKISLIVQKEEKENTPSKEDHSTFVTHKAATVPMIPKTRKIHQQPVPQ